MATSVREKFGPIFMKSVSNPVITLRLDWKDQDVGN